MREKVEFEKSIVRLFREIVFYLKSSSEIKYIFSVHKYLALFYSSTPIIGIRVIFLRDL